MANSLPPFNSPQDFLEVTMIFRAILTTRAEQENHIATKISTVKFYDTKTDFKTLIIQHFNTKTYSKI